MELQLPPFQYAVDAREQTLELKWFGHEVVRAECQAVFCNLELFDPGQHDDFSSEIILSDLSQDLQSIHLGHAHVENHEILVLVPQDVQSGDAALGFLDFESVSC